MSAKLQLPATVESDPARTAAVLTPLGGRVLEIKVALGDRVHQGQVLAVIDSPDLGQAYDDNDKAADAAQLTAKNLTRQEEQLKLGTVSSRDLDQARSDDTQAAARNMRRTQARLKTSWRSRRGKKHTLLAVESPVSGSVTALAIARGNMVNDPTQPIMTVADLSTVWVTALVPEKGRGRGGSQPGSGCQSVDLSEGKVLHGEVLFVGDDDRAGLAPGQVAHCRSRIPDVSLKPNMFATVTTVGSA